MKPVKKILSAFLITALSLPAMANSDTTVNDIQAAIHHLESALNDTDLRELDALYAEDATLIPAEADALTEKSAINSFWDSELGIGKSRYKIDVIDFQVNNNVAYLSALWSATVINPAPHLHARTQVEIKDGYMTNVLSRQQDGRWKIQVQSWN